MITNLHVENIGIIDNIDIELNDGFNVLTGETGAGKSLIIDSLMMVCGYRFSKEMIRKGKNYSLVELCIFLPDNENSEDGNIIVSRQIYDNGRNLCKINGRMVTVSELRNFMQDIIDIHGQSDNQKLMQAQNHITFLDNYIQNDIKNYTDLYEKLYKEYQGIKKELSKNYGNDKEKERTLDLLNYQLNEILNASLKIGEEEELEKTQKILKNSEKIITSLGNTDNLLNSQILPNFDKITNSLGKIENYDEKYSMYLEKIQTMYYELQDISYNISSELTENEYSISDTTSVQDRLDLIFNLKRKYGSNISDILKYKEDVQRQIYEIENMEEYILTLKNRLNGLKKSMYNISMNLHECRKKGAKILEEKITDELKDLEMINAKFKINVELLDNENYNSDGLDSVEFLISTNVGEEYKPLVKIASGGELSRIMLALKNVFSDVDKTPVMIFDEIDTGISGIAAKSVSQKMDSISKKHQIICVTHLAAVAARAKHNYYISKEVINDKTYSMVKLLNDEETLNEIARIATGKITKVALEHALELKKQSSVAS